MAKQIFRKQAIERMSSPEQLDELMPVTSPHGWIALAGMTVALLMVIVWAVFGTIETAVPGSGALVRIGGVDPVTALQAGEVSDVFVEAGDYVDAGSELFRVRVTGAEGKDTTHTIRSERAGRVLDVAILPGDTVQQGDVLLALESPNHPLQAVLYVPARDGYKVHRGHRVRITPATADRYSSRDLVGTVRSASRFPATRAAIFRALQNDDWVNEILRQGPVLEVIVEFHHQKDVEDYYSGTPCTAQITVDEKRPIEFVLPTFGSR